MIDNQDSQYIDHLITQIELKLNWGSSDNWKQRDFETLIDLIYEQTRVQLSLSTLKRIWQKRFKKLPQQQTLNALVIFLGYKNWQEFKFSVHVGNGFEDSERYRLKRKTKSLLFVILVVCTLIVSVFFIAGNIANSKKNEKKEFPEIDEIQFNIEPVTNNLPNSVIFHYKVPSSKVDSVYIQQSWDKNRRERVSPHDSIHTSIYYYPGYYNTKLIINDSVVLEKPLHILTDGWLGLMTISGYDPIPTYLSGDLIKKDGYLYLSPSDLEQQNIPLASNEQWIHFFYSHDFVQLSSDNVVLETMVKNASGEGALSCQTFYLQMHFENGYAMIPLTIPGCISDIDLRFNDYYESGKNNNLKAFGCNMDEWQKIKLISNINDVSIEINDTPVRHFNTSQNSGKLKYLQFRFRGCGKIDYVKLSDKKGQLVYKDDF